MPKTKGPTKEDSSKVPSSSTALLLIRTFFDTTWRLFVPAVLGVVLGLLADYRFDTKPWFTATGVVIGFLLAVWLVYLQIKSIQKSS